MAEWVWQGCHTLLQIAVRIEYLLTLLYSIHTTLKKGSQPNNEL